MSHYIKRLEAPHLAAIASTKYLIFLNVLFESRAFQGISKRVKVRSLNIPKCKLCPLFKPQWVWFTAVELAILILSCSLNGFKLFRAWGSKADPDPSTLLQSERWDAPYLCTEKMPCSHIQADVQYHTKSSALICCFRTGTAFHHSIKQINILEWNSVITFLCV